MTWLTGWNYRKAITVSNAGSALTDYQVLVTVDTATLVTAGKLQSTCNDIRFTSSNGSTPLPYWIESGPNTSSTKIWVKISSILANPSVTTIYLYYGNSGATAESNGSNTFVYFNPLNSALDITNNFNIYNMGTGATVFDATKEVSNGTGSMKLYSTATDSSYTKIISKGTYTAPLTIEWDEMTDTTTSDGNAFHGMLFLSNTSNPTVWVTAINNGVGFYTGSPSQFPGSFNIVKSGTAYGSPITPTGVSANAWHRFVLSIGSNGVVRVSIDGNLYSLDAGAPYNLDGISLYISVMQNSWHNNVNNWIDNIKIRKYSSSEPIVTYPIGSEETQTCGTPSANLIVLEIVSNQLLRQYPSYIDLDAISKLLDSYI